MRGLPVFIQARPTGVEVWVSSPTGDSSDSIILNIPALNAQQANEIALEWAGMAQIPFASCNDEMCLDHLRFENMPSHQRAQREHRQRLLQGILGNR
jgi:hypothetical protein